MMELYTKLSLDGEEGGGEGETTAAPETTEGGEGTGQ